METEKATLDPPLPGADPIATTRRLAAGDWVHVTGPNPSLAGIGKIVDGEYAPRDNVLLQARVELARGTYWFSPNALARLEPSDEALLCSEAALRGCLTSAQAERVRGDVASLARGELVFVRSPGLLDRLWNYLGERDELSPTGLVRIFDEGASIVASARRRATASAPRARAVETQKIEKWDPIAPTLVTPARPVRPSRDVLLRRILSRLNIDALRHVAGWAGVELVSGAKARELRDDIVDSDVTLSTVLNALTPGQRSLALESLGEADALRALSHTLDLEREARERGTTDRHEGAPPAGGRPR